MTNQIIEVPDIAVVKTVDGAKKLFSLRDQKIKKETLHDFGNGSGVKYNEDLYVLGSGIIPIVRMTTTKIDPSFTVNKSGDIEVDWGDGMREKNVFSHTYSDGAAEHEIVFYGENTALTSLECSSNRLTTLNVDNNTALTFLDCNSNQLAVLNTSKNTKLVQLHCCINQISILDISQNILLKVLNCCFNQLTILTIASNTKLFSLDCRHNQLTTLDVTRDIGLKLLSCSSNQISDLDVSLNVLLEDLWVDSNTLTSINISRNLLLRSLSISDNKITSLDVSKNTELQSIELKGNPIAWDYTELVNAANSLVDRNGKKPGTLQTNSLLDTEIKKELTLICDTKNWISLASVMEYYNIEFLEHLGDSKFQNPEDYVGININSDCITFPYGNSDSYLIYNIGDILSKSDIFDIYLDIRLDRINQRDDTASNRAPIFKLEDDILYTDPMNIFTAWVLGGSSPAGENKETIYVAGVPDDPAGIGAYAACTIGEWNTIKLKWNYNTKELYVYKNNKPLSVRWPFITRNYTRRPTKIQFGWKNSQAKCYCSIRNFKLVALSE